ncbi:hypothetical protein MRB53_041352 [Persea americana]|nr:hypothetical protein MRB53_041352 [Persea americana]
MLRNKALTLKQIMHGLYSFNVAAHAVLKAFGGSKPENFREFGARFAAPVIPGDKLVIEMWKTGDVTDGFEDIRFIVRVEGKKVVLSNGRALVKAAAGGSKL